MWTSALPGLDNAGSSFSGWLVVIIRILPSKDLTPSSAFNKPENVTVYYF